MSTHPTKMKIIAIVVLLVCGSAMGAPNCNAIMEEVVSCIPYLLRVEAQPPEICCDGVKLLSKEDPQAICHCVQAAANAVGPNNFSLFASLPQNCGMSFKFPPISNDIDCSKV